MRFLAVQCFSCRAIQVRQAKKTSNKWSCSICNEKQSLRKVFFSSDAAKDVRGFVQQANLARGLSEEEALPDGCFLSGRKEHSLHSQNALQEAPISKQHTEPKKWERFLSKEDVLSDEEECEDPEEAKYVTTIPDRKSRNPRCRSLSSSEGDAKRGTCSANKRSADESARHRELEEIDLHSGYSKPTDWDVIDDRDSEVHRENQDLFRYVLCPSGTADGTGGTSKRGYSVLAGESSHEEPRVSKKGRPQYQSSKWSKYLAFDDDG